MVKSAAVVSSGGADATENRHAQVVPLLRPVDKCWQPSDFLPASQDPDFLDKVRSPSLSLVHLPTSKLKRPHHCLQVHDLRERAKCLPDDYLVVFAGKRMGSTIAWGIIRLVD